MSWLFLDTHAPGMVRVGRFDGTRNSVRTLEDRAPAALLEVARQFHGEKPDGVCVVAGPGSFSSVRTGVLYANVLARWWRVPLVGVRSDEAEESKLPDLASRLAEGRIHPVAYVGPIYDAEPNITLPKTV